MFDFSYDFLFLCTSVLKWVRASLGFMCSADSRALCLPRTSPGNVAQTSVLKIKFKICRKFAQILIFTCSRILSRPLQNNRTNRQQRRNNCLATIKTIETINQRAVFSSYLTSPSSPTGIYRIFSPRTFLSLNDSK